jgi:pilus assembly protein CpaE
MTTIWDLDAATATALYGAVGEAAFVGSLDQLHHHLDNWPDEDTVVIGPTVDLDAALHLSDTMRVIRPTVGTVLVRHHIDTELLSEAIRAGVREVVDQRDLAGLHTAVQRSHGLSTALRQQQPDRSERPLPPRGRVVTVFSAKGGCGKTTLATNMAAALADHGQREVCLVDLDLAFGDVAIALQLFPAHTIADTVALGEQLDYTALHGLLTPHSPGLTTLVAPVEPGNDETIPATLVGHILEVLRAHYDYVVVDTPPAFDDQVLTAFDMSDVVCLVATLDIPALKNLKIALETMELLNYQRERWRVVLNRSDSKVGLAIGDVEKTLHTTISVQIPSSRDVPAAINRGVPIVLDDPRHPVSVAIRNFSERQVAGPAALHALETALTASTRTRSQRRGRLRRKARV